MSRKYITIANSKIFLDSIAYTRTYDKNEDSHKKSEYYVYISIKGIERELVFACYDYNERETILKTIFDGETNSNTGDAK